MKRHAVDSLIIALAIVARIAAVWVLQSPFIPRSTYEHGEIAANLVAGRGFSIRFLARKARRRSRRRFIPHWSRSPIRSAASRNQRPFSWWSSVSPSLAECWCWVSCGSAGWSLRPTRACRGSRRLLSRSIPRSFTRRPTSRSRPLRDTLLLDNGGGLPVSRNTPYARCGLHRGVARAAHID